MGFACRGWKIVSRLDSWGWRISESGCVAVRNAAVDGLGLAKQRACAKSRQKLAIEIYFVVCFEQVPLVFDFISLAIETARVVS